ncbi:hypothetical protein MXB_2115 [Myxobolus squamalis]|nr:hypothetical protein MXB_2115 [Myxobolus squamalis]
MFWEYFIKTWIKKFSARLWNIHQIGDEEILARKNKCIKRYNRRFGEIFMNAHPNITVFVFAIRAEFKFYCKRCQQIRKKQQNN